MASRSYQQVIMIGNLAKDPESRSFPNGGSVTNCTIATSESWRDKDGNEQERVEWHNVVFHNKLGEIVAQYARKGTKVFVQGKNRTRKWQDKATGTDRYITEVHADEMQLLGDPRRGEGDSAAPSGRMRDNASDSSRGNGGSSSSYTPPSDAGFEDEDVPF